MKYSISNIAWSKEYDNEMYAFLKQQGIDGLEIAPTRIFDKPYDNLELAHEYAWMLKNKYGLTVSSMQSIWYGVKESIFGTDEDRAYLLDYTKKATTPRWFKKKDVGINEKEFSDWSKPFVSVSGDISEERFQQISLIPPGGIYFSLLERKIAELKETIGNRDVNSGGTGSGVTSGRFRKQETRQIATR